MAKPAFVYVTYIRTTPEKLWSALTDRHLQPEVLLQTGSIVPQNPYPPESAHSKKEQPWQR